MHNLRDYTDNKANKISVRIDYSVWGGSRYGHWLNRSPRHNVFLIKKSQREYDEAYLYDPEGKTLNQKK